MDADMTAMSGQRSRICAFAIGALVAETGAQLPAHGSLLPMLLGEPDGYKPWCCIRCGAGLMPRERYSCSGCLGRDDTGEPWTGQRPDRGARAAMLTTSPGRGPTAARVRHEKQGHGATCEALARNHRYGRS